MLIKPPWLEVAESYLGTRELKGEPDNPVILRWLKEHGKNLGAWGKNRDETPWCSVFVSGCLAEAGYQGTDHALARSYLTWGVEANYQLGSIAVVKWRGNGSDRATGSRAGFHVGFLTGVNVRSFTLLGGNQGNAVTYKRFQPRLYDLLALRFPETEIVKPPQVQTDVKPHGRLSRYG